MNSKTRSPSKSQLDELCHAMRVAIDARDIPEVERVFLRARHIAAGAKGSMAHHKQEKNTESARTSCEIASSVERLRGRWLLDSAKAKLRYIRATDTKIGAPTHLITLDKLGISRRESQRLQDLAEIPEHKFKATLADKSVMPTVACILRRHGKLKPTRTGPGPKIHSISLSSIESPPYRLRALRPDVVDGLADSMRDIGLINPITVGPREGLKYDLRAGLHRLVAARKLGWEKIPAIVSSGTDAIEAELVEIDENLVRADLTPAEQAAHHTRRKELYEQKHPETVSVTKRGGPGRGKKNGRQNGEGLADRYTKDAAEKTGDSERTIQRNVERGENIPNVAELSGTFLDQGTELDALAKLKDIAPERQAELIEKAKSGEKVSAKAEVKKAQREKQEAELAQQPDKPAPEPQDLAPASKRDNAPDHPAPPRDPWADQRAAFHGFILGLKSIDFDQMIASMPLEELRDAKDVFLACSAALHAAIDRATPVEEPMSPAA